MARTVLIIKLAAIGDVVMALSMINAIRAEAADTRIAWMSGKTVAPLLGQVAGIHEVIAVDEAAVLTGTPTAKLRAVFDAWRAVAGRRFDAVYIAHTDARYKVLGWSVFAAQRRWLGGGGQRRGIVPGRSHPDEYVRLVTGVDDRLAVRYPPPVFEGRLPEEIARKLHTFNPDSRPVVAIAPGGARNVARENPLRRWPLDRYVDLSRALEDRGYRVVLIGDALDDWVRGAFRGIPVLDLVGSTELAALVSLFSRCDLVVAHDSGPLHLARLAGTRVVALLGPTPPSMFFRADPRTSVLWPGSSLPCAPCYDGRNFAQCADNRCMQMIGTDDVLTRVAQMAPVPAHVR